MIDHHESARQVEVLGSGTEAERRHARVARLRAELRRRGAYLLESRRPWQPAATIVDRTIFGGLR